MQRLIKTVLALLMLCFFVSNSWASLSVYPKSINDTTIAGNEQKQVLFITNLGPSSVLSYTVASDQQWLKVEPQSGSVKVGDTVKITVTCKAGNLNPGVYQAKITVGDPHHGPITIPMDMTVNSLSDVNELINSPDMVKIYPNPFSKEVHFELSNERNEDVSIEVYDVLGRLAAKPAINLRASGNTVINWMPEKLAEGLYHCVIRIGDKSITKMVSVIN